MARPYALSLYTPVLEGSNRFEAALTNAAMGWRRSIRSMGGYWLGSFQLTGKPGEMQDRFDRWLGYQLQEKAGGLVTWEGMLYEMELTQGGVRYRVSLDELANAARATYTMLAYEGEDVTVNGDFELATGSPPDPFDGWDGERGTGGDVQATATAHGGSSAAKLIGDSDGGDNITTYLRQNLNLTAGRQYQLIFWTRGDGTHAGTYGVKDPNQTHPAGWIVGSNGPITTGVAGTTYTQVTVTFTAPADSEVFIWFGPHPDLGAEAYFDDVTVREQIEVVRQSDWALAASSIARYGRKEEILILDRYPQATSEALRDVTVKERGDIVPQAAGWEQAKAEATLDVKACGYIFTANWMHLVEGDGADHDLSHWIAAIVGASFGLSTNHGGAVGGAGDCQFLRTGNVATNTLQVTEETSLDERAWDRMRELAELGDAIGTPWRLYCDNDRRVHYQPISSTPRYYLRRGQLYERLASTVPANPWTVRPAVVRDMDYLARRALVNSWLGYTGDFYVEEVEVDDAGRLTLKTALYSEAEALAARLAAEQEKRGGRA